MLPSSSGEFEKLEPGFSSLLKNPRRPGAGDTVNKPSSGDRFASSSFINFSIVALVLASIYLQCGESRSVKDQAVVNDPFNVLDPALGEVACFCNGKFYQSCPPKQSGCILRKKSRRPKVLLSPDPYELLHDSEHPDHVEMFDSVKGNWPMARNPLSDDGLMIQSNGTGANLDDIVTTDTERVVRHRKVYVSEKLNERDPVIHPIELTIPVKIKNEQDPPLPPPKPVFKLRKYTTYETKPEIEMVPITTTVYKPVGVSKDQIIDYKKSQ